MTDDVAGRTTIHDVPVAALLHELMVRISSDIPGALGAAISVRHDDRPPTALIATGIAEHLVPAQIQLFGGPVPDAAATEERVVTDGVFTDPRWPKLTCDSVTELFPALAPAWQQVRGVVALPHHLDDAGTVVVSAVLDRPDTTEALGVLTHYENIVVATLVVAEAQTAAGSENMIAVLRSRGVIEQAKGAIIAIRRCTSDEAWEILRRASQQFNIKVRDLAVALVEYLSHAPLSTLDGVPAIVPSSEARSAAELLWAAFTTPTRTD